MKNPAKNTANFRCEFPRGDSGPGSESGIYDHNRPAQPAAMNTAPAKCKHPRVRIVAREEDAEFVECLECGEVFESSEFRDMDIEESKLAEEG
jgi:hypothetical protein